MIEKMNLLYVIAQESKKSEMLDALRELGIMHISQKSSADDSISARFNTLQKLSFKLKDYAPKKNAEPKILSDEEFEEMFCKTQDALRQKNSLEESVASKRLAIEKIKPWGNFDPAEIRKLKSSGLNFRFYQIDKKDYKKLSDDEKVKYIKLSAVDKTTAVATLGQLDREEYNAIEFEIPEKGIAELEAEIKQAESELIEIDKLLCESALALESYKQQLIKIQNDAEYSAVSNTAVSDGGLVWLKGYIPLSETERFTECAAQNGWAYQYETVEVDDGFVPTKVKYNKLTALIKPIFELLGTVPGYGEYDISFWFLAFFTLFFAMIIGDAGYGAIFLIGAIVLIVKSKKFTNASLLLLVLSIATIIWGALTGTWFGLEAAMEVPLLRSLVVPSFANFPEYFGVENTFVQNSIMKFCFSIGVIQLSLACLMNIRRKITTKNLSMFADLGWLMSICALYFLVLFLVVNQPVNIALIGGIVGIGFVLVVLFGGMAPDKTFGKGLKDGLGSFFTVFLDTIGAFGNVMSYIRLFAVGMASLAIAQSFNTMSSGFTGVLVVVGIIIAVLGHVLNIVMGLLSVVVHGVRLNLLEFSGQLGMEWSGTAFEPFREYSKLKK